MLLRMFAWLVRVYGHFAPWSGSFKPDRPFYSQIVPQFQLRLNVERAFSGFLA